MSATELLTSNFSTLYGRSLVSIACCRYAFHDDQHENFRNLGFQNVSFVEDIYTSTELYVASTDHFIVVVFRATKTWRDWITDIKARFSKTEIGKAHKGFSNAYYSVKFQLERIINHHQDLYEESYNLVGRKRIFLFGHSLGGALSTMAMADIKADELITFGSPRCFSRSLSKRFESELGDRCYRYSSAGDFISHVPPSFMNYRHVGKHLYFTPDGHMIEEPPTWRVNLDQILDLFNELKNMELFEFEDHSSLLFESLLLRNDPRRQ